MNTGGASKSPSSRNLAGFLEMAFDAAVTFDAHERITYWNPAAVQMFGWTAQEALGKIPAELFRPGRTSQQQKRQRQVKWKRGETLRGKHNACRKDGSSLRVQYAAQAIFDAKGEVAGSVVIYRDISVQVQDVAERKRAEEQLERSNQKLNEILASIRDDFYVLDRDWIFVYANRQFTSRIGKEPEDFVGNNIWEMFPKHEGTVFEENLRAAMEMREIRRFELAGKYTNTWYSMTVFPSPEGITVLGTDITERMRVENALRQAHRAASQSEERYRHLVKHAPAGIYELDPETMRFLEVNDSMCQILGYTREELLSIVPEQLLDEEGRQRFRERMFRMLRGEKVSEETEYRVRTRDGRYLWSALNVTINYEGGKPRSVSVIAHDITERKRGEQALAQAMQELHEHINNSPLAVVAFDAEYHITEWSAGAERMFGWRAEEVLHKRIVDLRWVHEDDAQRIASLSADMLAGRTLSNVQANRNYRKDGSLIECEWYNSALLDANGNLISVRSQVLDVTERKRARQQIFESNQRLLALMNALPVGVSFSDDPTCQRIRGNPVALAQFEVRSEDNLSASAPDNSTPGRQVQYFCDGKFIPDVDLPLQRAVAENREIPPMELEVHLPSGRRWWASASGAPIHDQNGNVIGGVAVTQDITARKQTENALRENQQQLQLLNETLEQKVQEKTAQVRLLSAELIKAVQQERHRISHILHDDLQQRIYAIQMQLTFLHDELKKEEEAARKEVSNIQKQLAEILEITRHLSIDLSPPILRDEGLSHAINWLAAQMQQRYGLPIELQADGPFAIADEELHVLLFNCVRELLFNVVKHAQASRAVVTLQWVDAGLQIEVRDDGSGFPANILAEQTSAGRNGADDLRPGFGLSTVRHQLSLFGGCMEIQSEPGAGARVTLIVPAGEAG